MDYTFGTRGDLEILRTKGPAHARLTGWQRIERIYPDQTVTDSFRVVRRLNRRRDEEGNCYDWYEIDRHNRQVDKTGPLTRQAAEAAALMALMENAVCELDTGYDERLSAVEDALCELDSLLNGGEEA